MDQMILTNIRWMVRRDIDTVLSLDSLCFYDNLTHLGLVRLLKQPNVIGSVFEIGDDIHGFMLYSVYRTRYKILRLAVRPAAQRLGFGTQAIDKMKGKLGGRRLVISLDVPEDNLGAQLFFKSQDFLAVSVNDTTYTMEYRCPN